MLVLTARFVWNLVRLPFVPLWWLGRLLSRPRGEYVHVRLSHQITEVPHEHPLIRRFLPMLGRVLPTPLSAIRRLIHHVSRDPKIRGVVFEIPPLATGWATASALRRVIGSLREANVKTIAYLPHGGGNREIFVATAADRVVLGPQATLAALGLSLESRYLKPLLDKLGVRVEAMAQGQYKTAAESVTRDSMSEPQREQLEALLSTLDGELVQAIASRPGMDEARARALFEQGFLHGEDAVAAGLADAIAYDDELPTKLDPERTEPARLVPAGRYLAFREARFFRRMLPAPYVAVIELHGAIVGEGARRGAADPRHLAAALRMARRDRFAVGVILHVSSPGGSALASDQIHREIVRLREKKPVVTCMGDVAASGGYYVAAPTHAIVADATTITGSIGVVTARVVARELFETLGIKTETIRLAPHADMFSASREPTDTERAIIEKETAGFYRAFVGVVADGRKRPYEEIEPLARGRVWSGKDALAQGLVDRLGGMEAALDEIRARAGLPKAIADHLEPVAVRPRRLDIPPPEAPAEAAARAATATALAALSPLAPELGPLLAMVARGERALYLALGLPQID